MSDSPELREFRLAKTLQGLHEHGQSIEQLAEMSGKTEEEVERLIALAVATKKKH
jgi:hypothetical protein